MAGHFTANLLDQLIQLGAFAGEQLTATIARIENDISGLTIDRTPAFLDATSASESTW